MFQKKTPLLSIGLPVYNGENYLRSTLDAIVNQTFQDYELIITDNASTDSTRLICQEYAARDPRIQYYRNTINIGAANNFNRVFHLSKGRFFKWAAADDLISPDFLLDCISYLENHKEVLLCYTKADRINATGEVDGTYDYPMRVNDPNPHIRFGDLVLTNHFCIAVFGVFRREALAKTPLIGKYVGSDRVLLAFMSLLGPLYEIPKYLFHRRDHPQASGRLFNKYKRLAWFDPSLHNHLNLLYWRMGFEYFSSVLNVDLPIVEKLKCFVKVAVWFYYRKTTLLSDLKTAIYQYIPISRSLVQAVKKSQT